LTFIVTSVHIKIGSLLVSFENDQFSFNYTYLQIKVIGFVLQKNEAHFDLD